MRASEDVMDGFVVPESDGSIKTGFPVQLCALKDDIRRTA